MLKNVILDYMGVLAEIDYKKMLKNLSLTEKFKALRILVGLKKNKHLITAFDNYQLGLMNQTQFFEAVSKHCPHAAPIVPKLLGLLPECIHENSQLIELIAKLHNDGFKIFIISNSIPETQQKLETSELVMHCDGFVLSHLVGMMKPHRDIFDFTCECYGLKPEDSLMVDDKPENLEGAKKARLKTFPCEDFNNIAKRLGNFFYSKYQPSPME